MTGRLLVYTYMLTDFWVGIYNQNYSLVNMRQMLFSGPESVTDSVLSHVKCHGAVTQNINFETPVVTVVSESSEIFSRREVEWMKGLADCCGHAFFQGQQFEKFHAAGD